MMLLTSRKRGPKPALAEKKNVQRVYYNESDLPGPRVFWFSRDYINERCFSTQHQLHILVYHD